jgi:hypothetical protein
VRFFVRILAADMLIVLSFGRPCALQLWAHLAVSYLVAVATNRTHAVGISREAVIVFVEHCLDSYFIVIHFC